MVGLEAVKILAIEAAFTGSVFYKAEALEKKLIEMNFLLNNRIQRECGLVDPVDLAWCALAVKV